MDPLTTAGKLGKAVFTALSRLEEENTRPFLETAVEDFLSERARALQKRIERLEAENATNAQVEDLFTDEFFFLQKNYEFEAIREARKERRRMLAYAAAGAVSITLRFSDVTRVERALRSLEPEDVMVLGGLAEFPDPKFHVREQRPENLPRQQEQVIQAHERRHQLASFNETSADALIVAGCLRLDEPFGLGRSGMAMTELGELVTRVLGDYLQVVRAEGKMEKACGYTRVP